MKPSEIKAELKKQRATYASIGDRVGVSRQAVHQVIEKRWISERIMSSVADAIGRDRAYVFPEYFLEKRSGIKKIAAC